MNKNKIYFAKVVLVLIFILLLPTLLLQFDFAIGNVGSFQKQSEPMLPSNNTNNNESVGNPVVIIPLPK